ncbi:hypothetical protein TcWFU_007176 [Taenia crassiceps]|uniref:Uncharacterized protein n=1 Tax=Taenia crassiceps TaxID=6207 RepID=A0ABR4Q1P6_9CEST
MVGSRGLGKRREWNEALPPSHSILSQRQSSSRNSLGCADIEQVFTSIARTVLDVPYPPSRWMWMEQFATIHVKHPSKVYFTQPRRYARLHYCREAVGHVNVIQLSLASDSSLESRCSGNIRGRYPQLPHTTPPQASLDDSTTLGLT